MYRNICYWLGRFVWPAAAISCVFGLLTGCTQQLSPEQPGGEVTLQVVDRAGYQAVLKKHRDKVVLVEFWATWCYPCKEQFPHTVQLSRTYAGDGLAVVSVSLDEPDKPDQPLAFLREQGATFDNLLSKFGTTSKSFKTFDLEAVPHFKLYDRTGKLRKTSGDPTADPFTTEDIEAEVKRLLAEPSG